MNRRMVVGCSMFLSVLLIPVVLLAQPKNVILCIGDGMGLEQVKAAEMFEGRELSFRQAPYQALCTTYAASAEITDSAAAATAIATGVKVDNGVISLDPGTGEPLLTLLEDAKADGKSTALVTTTYLTHATPAAFGAHEASRNNLDEIAGDYLADSQPDVLFGGGGNSLSVSASETAGYLVATDLAGFLALDPAQPMISAQIASSHLEYVYDYLGSDYPYPMLDEMVAKALAAVGGDENGFFLMVEGGRIDHACHDNEIERTVHETLAFESAVDAALLWAGGRDDTLVLVTADHETGGLTCEEDLGAGLYPLVSWASTGHTAADVPVYAWGKNAELVGGLMDNTDFFTVCTTDSTPVYEATNPFPGDGATGVPVDVVLSWTPGVDATLHHVYLGTNPDPRVGGSFFSVPLAEYAPPADLDSGMTYSWCVDEEDGDGNVTQGAVWTFTTIAQPEAATLLNPGDGAADVATGVVLTWVPGNHSGYEEVWFGTAAGGLDLVDSTTGTSYDPGELEHLTTYVWKLVSVNSAGFAETELHSFTTADVPPPVFVVASGESTTKGTIVSGDFTATHTDDDVFEGWEVLREVVNVPNKNGYSTLDHTWTFDVGPSQSAIFYVNAWLDAASMDQDAFTFSYSTDAEVYTPMVTIAHTYDAGWSTFDLPAGLSGTVYVRVEDTDHTKKQQLLDTLIVDGLGILTSTGDVIKQYAATEPQPADGAADIDFISVSLQWTPGDDAVLHDIYVGSSSEDPDVFIADGTNVTSVTLTDLTPSTVHFWRVDERDADGQLLAEGSTWTFTTRADGSSEPTTVSLAGIVVDTLRGDKGAEIVRATVTLRDDLGGPVENATVYGEFEVDGGSARSALSDSSGVATLTSAQQAKKPPLGFSVTNVEAEGLVYQP